MDLTTLDAELAVASFVETLRARLPDDRDRRGKLPSLEFTVTAVVLAMLCRCQSVSSIHRFIGYRLKWLRHVTGMRTACALSRAHLPRLLNRIDWTGLNLLITECFGATVGASDWVAVGGNVLRGSSRDGEHQALVIAVAHATGQDVARLLQAGPKTSEIPVVRQLLKDTGLECQKVTMDAGHCNPTPLAQIAQAGGTALVQVKENQPELLYVCGSRAVHEPALARLSELVQLLNRINFL